MKKHILNFSNETGSIHLKIIITDNQLSNLKMCQWVLKIYTKLVFKLQAKNLPPTGIWNLPNETRSYNFKEYYQQYSALTNPKNYIKCHWNF